MLAVVTPSGDRALATPAGVATLQSALDDWPANRPALCAEYERLVGDESIGERVGPAEFLSPLPRAYQWCEGSTYLAHMERMRRARGMALPPEHTLEPIVYQAGADRLLAPLDPIPLPDPAWGLDLEATLAVITDDVPLGTTSDEAQAHVAFLVLTNDLTYRNLIAREYAKSVGPYQSKPARAFAPIAVTPAALGDLWNGRVLRATVKSWVNGALLGAVASDQDNVFDFAEMIAYAARTRELAAGTIIGTGTVSNRDLANGFGCLGEKRAVEIAATGVPQTPWLTYGDTVRIEVFGPDAASLFGAIEQTVTTTATEEI
jgi:fumarylacetoacetate (FAA) hydrolase